MRQSSNNQIDLNRKLWSVLGLVFDEVDIADTVNCVKHAVDEKQNCFISTPNLNFVVTANSNDMFFSSVIESELSLADGMPIIWVAKLLGIPLKERVAGSTLFEALNHDANGKDEIRVFFFGGQPGIAQQAHQKLNSKNSLLTSCGFYDPGFVDIDEMSHQSILDEINATAPDFVVVALGAAKGQQWILQNKNKLSAPVVSHLGAVINFVAGSVTRAPVFWQRIGLEWLWRIKQEPSLWKRYLFDGFGFIRLLLFKVVPLAIYDRYLKKFQSSADTVIQFNEDEGVCYCELKGLFSFAEMPELLEVWQKLLDKKKNIILDLSSVTYIDSAFIAQLLLFQHKLKKHKNEITLYKPSDKVSTILSLSNVKQRFKIHKIEK